MKWGSPQLSHLNSVGGVDILLAWCVDDTIHWPGNEYEVYCVSAVSITSKISFITMLSSFTFNNGFLRVI